MKPTLSIEAVNFVVGEYTGNLAKSLGVDKIKIIDNRTKNFDKQVFFNLLKEAKESGISKGTKIFFTITGSEIGYIQEIVYAQGDLWDRTEKYVMELKHCFIVSVNEDTKKEILSDDEFLFLNKKK